MFLCFFWSIRECVCVCVPLGLCIVFLCINLTQLNTRQHNKTQVNSTELNMFVTCLVSCLKKHFSSFSYYYYCCCCCSCSYHINVVVVFFYSFRYSCLVEFWSLLLLVLLAVDYSVVKLLKGNRPSNVFTPKVKTWF